MRKTLERPALRLRRNLRRWTLAGLSGFWLALLSLGSSTLPLGGCLCAVLPGLAGFFAAAGAMAGYFVRFPFLQALEPAAAAVMRLCLAAILRRSALPCSRRRLCVISAGATFSVGLIYAVGEGPVALVWLTLRCCVSVCATAFFHYLLYARPAAEDTLPAQTPIAVSRALRTAGELLRQEASDAESAPVSALYDQATEQVCLRCPGYHRCFELEGARTYEALQEAAERFIPRGAAEPGDFPRDFLEGCRRPDALLRAVNGCLKSRLRERQADMRRSEVQRVLGRHFRILSELTLHEAPPPEPGLYRAELGVRAMGRRGSRISGDRGACFRSEGRLYLLLCDGMGTGPEAAREARLAIGLLEDYLKAGAKPEDALTLLGGIYLLRGSGCFSTVDLLSVDLSTGSGELYKWGAAPSYLIDRGQVRKMGTASPPPGLEEERPKRMRLSLGRGEKLVLLSDGAENEQTRARLEALGDAAPQRIASELIDREGGSGEDDLSAVVLRLRPIPGDSIA